MKLNDFQAHCRRVSSFLQGTHYVDAYKPTPELVKGTSLHKVTMALGLVNEVNELFEVLDSTGSDITQPVSLWMTGTRDQALKEMGDVAYYQAELATAYGSYLDQVLPRCKYQDALLDTTTPWLTLDELRRQLRVAATNLGEFVKKQVAHGHALDLDKFGKLMHEVRDCLAGTAAHFGWTLEFVMIENVAKLRKRYPEGFDSARSINKVAD